MKKQVLAFLLAAIFVLFFVGSSRTLAQTDTPTGPSNDVQGYFVVCADSAVVNFTGSMLAGFDIYFQLFAGTTGSGTALTGVTSIALLFSPLLSALCTPSLPMAAVLTSASTPAGSGLLRVTVKSNKPSTLLAGS